MPQRLDLTFLVRAQDQCFLRRIEIQLHDVADFLDEQRILVPDGARRPRRGSSSKPSDGVRRRNTLAPSTWNGLGSVVCVMGCVMGSMPTDQRYRVAWLLCHYTLVLQDTRKNFC